MLQALRCRFCDRHRAQAVWRWRATAGQLVVRAAAGFAWFRNCSWCWVVTLLKRPPRSLDSDVKAATQAVKNGVQRALEAAVTVSNRYCLWSASLLGDNGELTADKLMDASVDKDSPVELPVTDKADAALQLWHKRKADVEKL